MKTMRVSTRYARALLDLAASRGEVDRVTEDLGRLRRILDSSREFVLFLRSPVVNREKKRAVITEVFPSVLSETTFTFLLLLIEKGREEMLEDVIARYHSLLDVLNGVITLEVRSAGELSPSERETLSRVFEERTGKRIRLSVRADRTLLGGVVARLGDTVFDGSLRRQLDRMREQLAGGKLDLN